jgi:hypothetical protein
VNKLNGMKFWQFEKYINIVLDRKDLAWKNYKTSVPIFTEKIDRLTEAFKLKIEKSMTRTENLNIKIHAIEKPRSKT